MTNKKKYKKKYHDFYIQRRFIYEIFLHYWKYRDYKAVERAISSNITVDDFIDENIKKIYKWILDRYRAGKSISIIKAHLELKNEVGDLRK